MDNASKQTLNRRQFLGLAAAVGGFALTAGCTRAGEPRAAEGVDDVRAFDESFESAGAARSIEEITKSGSFYIGVCSDAKPYAFLDGSGSYAGLDIGVADAVAWDLDAKPVYVETDPADIGAYLKAHKVDVVFCSTAPAAEGCLQATPYVAAQQAIVAGESASIKETGNLAGKKVAVCEGSFAERFARETFAGADIRPYPTYTTLFQALKQGAVEAVCVDQVMARAWVKSNKGYKVMLDDLGEPCPAGMQLAPDNDALLQHMNKETATLVGDQRMSYEYKKHVQPAVDGDYKKILLKVEPKKDEPK